MNRIIPTSTMILLLLTALILALGGCGGGGSSSGGGGGGGGTTSATTGGGGTTSTTTGGGGTVPAEMANATVNLTPSRGSGVSGVATLTNTADGVEVALNVQNLTDQPGTEHIAHIHQGGTCADDRAGNGAPVQYPLNSITTEQGGTGSSTTVIQGVTVAQLFSGTAKYLNVHAEKTGNQTPPGISCADLSSRGGTTGATSGGGTTSGGGGTTGGSSY